MGYKIEPLVLGELAACCYLLWDEKTGKGVVIDPADEGGLISQWVSRLQIQPQAIIMTHGHFDHCLGALEVKLNFGCPVLLHKADWSLYKSGRPSAKHWLNLDPGPFPEIDAELVEGQKITFGYQTFTVLETPGHTPGSISLTNNRTAIFTGDTLFKESFGRTDLSYSNSTDLKKSLRKILELPKDCFVYPGHGETTIIRDCLDLLPRG